MTQFCQDFTIQGYLHYVSSTNVLTTATCIKTIGVKAIQVSNTQKNTISSFDWVHAVDFIDPWKATIHGREILFKPYTAIDLVTNLLEIIQINNKSSTHVTQQLSNCWISSYPWLLRVAHNNGGEFIAWEFKCLLWKLSIQSIPTIVKNSNSKSNTITERLYQTMKDVPWWMRVYQEPICW